MDAFLFSDANTRASLHLTDHMNKHLKEIPKEERPYEKCLKSGPEHLSDTELLAILLRSGIPGMNVLDLSRHLIHETGNLGLHNLHHLSLDQLMEIKGIGPIKAIQLSALAELTKRMTREKLSITTTFTSPDQIADYYMEELRHKEQEVMYLLILNSKCRLISECEISKGTVNATMISPREVYIEALKYKAVYIALLHNHPSGDANPSSEDILFTERMKEAGELLSIQLLDHIIIGDNCYYSFLEKQLKQKG